MRLRILDLHQEHQRKILDPDTGNDRNYQEQLMFWVRPYLRRLFASKPF